MGGIEGKVFRNVSADDFGRILREYQSVPFGLPSLYFAWEKSDGTAFMVATRAPEPRMVLLYEFEPSAAYPHAYGYSMFDISGRTAFKDAAGQLVDPIGVLVDEVKGYRFIGAWHDPVVLLEEPIRVAIGRFDEAMEKLGIDKEATLMKGIDGILTDAFTRASFFNEPQTTKREYLHY